MPNAFCIKDLRQWGENFFQYLKETQRDSITNKGELKSVYEEFKNRDSEKKPTFSGIIFALCETGRATTKKRTITIHQVQLSDQYHCMRRNKPPPASLPSNGDDDDNCCTTNQSKKIIGWIRKNRSDFIGGNEKEILITSEHDLTDGRIRFKMMPQENKSFPIHIKNNSDVLVTFAAFKFLRRMSGYSLEDDLKVSEAKPLPLNPGDDYEIMVHFSSSCYGYFPVILVFEFWRENDDKSKKLIIGRFLSAVCNSILSEELGPTSKYVPYKKELNNEIEKRKVEGVKPDSVFNYELEQEIPIGDFTPSGRLRSDIKAGMFSAARKNAETSTKSTHRAMQTPSDSFTPIAVAKAFNNKRTVRQLPISPLLVLQGGEALDFMLFPYTISNRDLLFSKLDFNNYEKRFRLMLHLEEIQMEVDIRKYDRKNEQMHRDPKNKTLLTLDVPGVAENRPSVIRGDYLFVEFSENKNSNVMFKGYVHSVEMEKVKLGFSEELLNQFINGTRFNVTFTFNRLSLRVQHRAVQLAKANNLEQFLFPTHAYGERIPDTEELVLYDRSLENNEQQFNAVKQIVSGKCRPAPYIIFGPPGTGKTVTMVEAIKQVLKCIPGAHILTCAPSNSACDLLCQRLIKHVDRSQIYRIMATGKKYHDIPEDIKRSSVAMAKDDALRCMIHMARHGETTCRIVELYHAAEVLRESHHMFEPCCNWDKRNERYVYPMKADLMNFRVIIITLVTAGRLASANFPKGHFSHVFIDESGHAVEPECVTAIAGILDVMHPSNNSNGGQLVLAGDPKQLGPIVRSPLALENGFDMSLLERLMTQNSLYQKDSEGYNSQFVTKLLRNYRSHPSILKIPNELFYDNELLPCADELLSNSYCNWEPLPRQGCPIIFHGVLGKDDREGNSPSFFNVNEVEEIMFYLKTLFQTQKKKGLAMLSPKDIGIISPYRRQVEKIRRAINLTCKDVIGINDLKVGSVEEFQGQERKVILVSTVRSSEHYVKHDEDFSLGFLKNPKRFNVTITRAKALLIIVGNPIILRKDPSWYRLLKYCCDEGAYTGNPIEDLDTMPNDDELTDLFSSLNIGGPPAGEASGESFVQQQAEPAWGSEA